MKSTSIVAMTTPQSSRPDRVLFDALVIKRRLFGGLTPVDVGALSLTARVLCEAIAECQAEAKHSVEVAAGVWLNCVSPKTAWSHRLTYGEKLVVDGFVEPDAVVLLAKLVDSIPILELVR